MSSAEALSAELERLRGLIGSEVLVPLGTGNLRVWVTVRDVDYRFGHWQLEVEPLEGAGLGRAWVRKWQNVARA